MTLMKSVMTTVTFGCSLATIGGLICPVMTAAQAGRVTVQFVARGSRPPNLSLPGLLDPTDVSFFGHVFIIVSVHTSSGPKEEIYGFYPKDGRSIIKGPGMLKSEFRCSPTDDCDPARHRRLAESTESVIVDVTLDQRAALLRSINKWNSEQYRLRNNNCTHFLSDVVQQLGYEPPAWLRGVLPVQYLRTLKQNVDRENERRAQVAREAARRSEEARKEEARRAEEQRREEEARREEQRRAEEARRIPAGWVPCSCPTAHAQHGRYMNGVLYHQRGMSCPR
jgi:hypothetical protein